MMIDEYLAQKGLVESVLTLEEIEDLAKQGKKVNIMMGQVFDDGQPIDLMKYALFIMNLEDILAQKGAMVSSNWVIADHFITDINKDAVREEISAQRDSRINYLSLLNDVYGGKIGFALSSKLSERPEYQQNLVTLKKQSESEREFRELVLQAVP